MTVHFEDQFDRVVTEREATALPTYVKVTCINNVVKKKEEYKKGILNSLAYYKESHEVDFDILEDYKQVSIIEILDRSTSGSFSIEDSREYRDNVLAFKHKSVFDKNGSLICSCPIDAQSGTPDYVETNKYYYNSSGEQLYQFWYGTKGDFSSMDSYHPLHSSWINPFKQHFVIEDLYSLPDFSWKDMQYYHHAEPLVPAECHIMLCN